ncbi:amidase [Saxibacter everestensis]|uniref:Amidase n=1 Tax=Saxibacter everestensis TaxID=2909229 RepID=A0ABY8QQT5_9MICO|nr:amidase [Brevibacteriaceae bacterium ZFBP1038]
MPEHVRTDLADWTATELLTAYRSKEVSPVEATTAALDRISKFNPEFNAFCLVDAESALRQARESEQRWRAGTPVGKLDGVPSSIKDLLLTKGWPTLRGSKLIDADAAWNEDAPVTARMREAGAVLLGKTTTPEFGWKGVTDNPLTGNTGNPWDSTKTSGGSSGGSAVAPALGMGPLSVGTDGGGSVRIPAAFSGVVGIKPTYGAVPVYPPSPFGTLSHAGPMTKTVADNALLLDVLSGFDSRDWSAMPRPALSYTSVLDKGVKDLRIGYCRGSGLADVDPEVAAASARAVEVLRALGARVDDVDVSFPDAQWAYHVLWFSGAAKVVDGYPRERLNEIDPNLLEIAEEGRSYSARNYVDANAVRASLGMAMGSFHERYDLLATPSVPIPAFEIGEEVPVGSGMKRWTDWTPFSYPFNLTQQPAISVPCGLTSTGLPIGLQLVAARHEDALLMQAANAYALAEPFGLPPVVTAG